MYVVDTGLIAEFRKKKCLRGRRRRQPILLNAFEIFTVPYKPYTDDTVMSKAVAESLIENKGINASELARR